MTTLTSEELTLVINALTPFAKQMWGLECAVCGNAECVVSAQNAGEALKELVSIHPKGFRWTADGEKPVCSECGAVN